MNKLKKIKYLLLISFIQIIQCGIIKKTYNTSNNYSKIIIRQGLEISCVYLIDSNEVKSKCISEGKDTCNKKISHNMDLALLNKIIEKNSNKVYDFKSKPDANNMTLEITNSKGKIINFRLLNFSIHAKELKRIDTNLYNIFHDLVSIKMKFPC